MAGIKVIPDAALTWPLCVAGRYAYTQPALLGQMHWHTEHEQPLASLLYVWQWDSHGYLLFYVWWGVEHRSWEDAPLLGSTPSLYYLNFAEEDTNPKGLTDLPGSWS